ncbi:MAG: M4 family metallopeptidase [Gammaproteobacteria bacterium]
MPTGDLDANAAYDFSGDTYDYFLNQHGRDSYNDAGAVLRSTVDFCPAIFDCPYVNAFWNGTQMVYGAGFSRADDVDAHELTHAVTEYTADLLYFMQSGALNESFSDIFGETIDLSNSGGTDTLAVRWQMGEDLPGIGALRNMLNPNAFNDPAKVSDTRFVCSFSDNGGVHSNSGVPNHAYALMVDGGSYNGQTVNGIGLDKAAAVHYRVLNHYLSSGSNFLDYYDAVQQACQDLIGTQGITTANCGEVKKALDAVELSTSPCGQPQEPDLCPVGQNPITLFFDDLENTSSRQWVLNNIGGGVAHWTYASGFARSGQLSLWGHDDDAVGDSAIEMTSDIIIPVAGGRMQFNHYIGFEAGYDGGVIEYSTNSGASWNDAGGLITAGLDYSDTLSTTDSNPLAGRLAFSQLTTNGYNASQLDLTSLAGQSVRFRFRVGTDPAVGADGWFIDDVRIYQCQGVNSEALLIDYFENAKP